jgi:hypothetical protein
MSPTVNYTEEAQDALDEFVVRAGKSFLVIRASNVFDDQQIVKITLDDLAEFYSTQANNLSSGIRTLAGLTGDWRPISELADLALEWFKAVNVDGMRRATRKIGLEPRF